MTEVTLPATATQDIPSVWILEAGERQEGGSIKGVYTNRDLALDDFLMHVRDLARRFGLNVDQTGEDPDTKSLYAEGGCDWISLTPYPVTTRLQLR